MSAAVTDTDNPLCASQHGVTAWCLSDRSIKGTSTAREHLSSLSEVTFVLVTSITICATRALPLELLSALKEGYWIVNPQHSQGGQVAGTGSADTNIQPHSASMEQRQLEGAACKPAGK